MNKKKKKKKDLRDEMYEKMINSADHYVMKNSFLFFGCFRVGAISFFLASMALQDIYMTTDKEKEKAGFGIN